MYMNGGTPRAKKERKVGIVFRHTEEPKHCAGVESLLLVEEHGILFTASRDSTIRRFDVNSPTPTCDATFEGHADWVNDLALVGDVLFSCSNDKTVRAWRAASQGPSGVCLSVLMHHTDYVTCLAAAPGRTLVASAGLRGEVFLIDAATGANLQLYPRQQERPPPPQQPQQQHGGFMGGVGSPGAEASSSAPPSKGSIYAMAMNYGGTVLAAGGTDGIVRVWDPRSQQKVCKLRGHTDNIRCLAANPDGTALLSGSSDGTIRLWDLGMHRCVQTYSVHSDSVWALAPSPDWSAVYSGGRDRAVYRTQLATRTAELLVVERQPIRTMALQAQDNKLWAGTLSSDVRQWHVPREPPTPPSADGKSFTAGRMRYSGMSPGHMRSSAGSLRPKEPLAAAPVRTIAGVPGIVAHKVLPDRRHVLAKDSEGSVALWDVLKGGPVQQFGKVDMDELERSRFEPQAVPAWFTSDNRLGALTISLEPPSAFCAEEYAHNLGYANVADDFKVNLGKLVLDGAFAKWRWSLLQQQQHHEAASGAQQQQQQPQQAGVGPPGAAGPQSPAAAASQQQQPQQLEEQQQQFAYTEQWPQYWQGVQPAVICQTAGGQHWCMHIGQLSSQMVEPDDVPSWVGDVVLRNANVTPKEAKSAFLLVPAEGSNLPALQQAKLNAPRILQVHKVASYCISKLQEQGITLEVMPVGRQQPGSGGSSPAAPAAAAAGGAPRYYLELVCNGMAVPYDMSLATVKRYIWKRSDDLVFHYRVLDPRAPAPLPNIPATAS